MPSRRKPKLKLGSTSKVKDATQARSSNPVNGKSSARTARLNDERVTKDDLVEYAAKLLMTGMRKAQVRRSLREFMKSHDSTLDDTSPQLSTPRLDTYIAEASRNIRRYSLHDPKELKRALIDGLMTGIVDDDVDYRSKAYGASVLSDICRLDEVPLVDPENIAQIAEAAQEEIDSDHVLNRDEVLRLQDEANQD